MARVFFIVLTFLAMQKAYAQFDSFSWTSLIPEHDTRDSEMRAFDDFDSQSIVKGINETEPAFHHKLQFQEVAIKDLLQASAPFSVLHFDAIHPLILTDAEKEILTEYLKRGGFILLVEDAYPYSQDEFWQVKEWPVIDFIRNELPAKDRNFEVQKIDDSHQLFHQVYDTKTAEMIKHELTGNPYTPNRTLVSYKKQPCIFVYGRYYYVHNGKWVANPRPFVKIFDMDPRGYQLTVNIIVYSIIN